MSGAMSCCHESSPPGCCTSPGPMPPQWSLPASPSGGASTPHSSDIDVSRDDAHATRHCCGIGIPGSSSRAWGIATPLLRTSAFLADPAGPGFEACSLRAARDSSTSASWGVTPLGRAISWACQARYQPCPLPGAGGDWATQWPGSICHTAMGVAPQGLFSSPPWPLGAPCTSSHVAPSAKPSIVVEGSAAQLPALRPAKWCSSSVLCEDASGLLSAPPGF